MNNNDGNCDDNDGKLHATTPSSIPDTTTAAGDVSDDGTCSDNDEKSDNDSSIGGGGGDDESGDGMGWRNRSSSGTDVADDEHR